MKFTDYQLDEGAAIAGGGYTIAWGDLEASYWNPPPDEQLPETLYVLNWDDVDGYVRLPIEKIQQVVRTETYVDKAVAAVEEYLSEEIIISQIPLIPEGGTAGTAAIDTYIACLGGEGTFNVDLNLVKWQAVGTWAQNNIEDIQSPSYLKLEKDSIFLIDENTFLIL